MSINATPEAKKYIEEGIQSNPAVRVLYVPNLLIEAIIHPEGQYDVYKRRLCGI